MVFRSLKQELLSWILKRRSLGFAAIILLLANFTCFPILRLTQKASAQTKPPRKQLTNSQQDEMQTFASLQQQLVNYGFQVKLEIPPYTNRYGRRPYGLVRNQEKTVWINPVVFELGNGLPVLIHEAVHAAQLCAGGDSFKPLDINLDAPQIASPYFLRYHNLQRQLEAEAYIVQTQPNSLDLVTELLAQHCSLKNQL